MSKTDKDKFPKPAFGSLAGKAARKEKADTEGAIRRMREYLDELHSKQ